MQSPIGKRNTVSTVGAFTAILSLVAGLLVLFVIPASYSFVSGLQLVVLSLLFLAGAATFFVGNVLSHRLPHR
ncbi:MAG: hypothetical protein HY530_05135 [Chloroflexi bacterium]|nr:hypothetical protein [Chloroflexota bacterium]